MSRRMYGIGDKRLLLVEDNHGDATYIRELLQDRDQADGEIVHVTCLADATHTLSKGQVDAVLLDLHLPDSVGVAGVTVLRLHAPDVPIVVLTGLQDHEVAFECIVAGAQDYLSKANLDEQGLRRALGYAIARIGESAQRERADTLRETMAAIVEASGDAILSASMEGIVTSWNRGAERIFGFRREEAIGRPVAEVMRAPDAAGVADQDLRVHALRRGEDIVQPVEVVRLNRQGERLIISMVACALHNALGQVVGVAGVCRDVTQNNRRDAELRRRNAQLVSRDRQMRELAKHLNAVREDERTRISREVHDVLGQLLTGIKMDVRWMDRRLAAEQIDVAALRSRLAEADSLTDQTIATVQRIALELRPSALDSLGLQAALRDEARRFETRSGVRTRVEIEGKSPTRQPVATALFRILQELLTNVVRHAKATSVSILLREEGHCRILQVVDDGVGMAADPWEGTASLGLLGMRERAEALGGSFEIEPQSTGGTVATVRMPENQEREKAT
jgi:two-component system, NarL family, sensor histidine kinase UhpB